MNRKCQTVIGNPVRLDGSFSGKLIAKGDNGSLTIPFNSDILIVSENEVIGGTLQKLSSDGFTMIIDGRDVAITNKIVCVGILD